MKQIRHILPIVACVVFTGACATGQARTATANPPKHPVATTSTATVDEFSKDASLTEDAVASALRFVCSGQRLLDTPPAQLPEVIRGLWSAGAADRAVAATIGQLTELRDRLEPGRGVTRYRQGVLAYRVGSASGAKVEVSVWWVGVLSREGAVLPQAEWTTSKVTVVLEDRGWRVDGESSEPGPVPDHSSDSEPITHGEFERRLSGFTDWEAPQ